MKKIAIIGASGHGKVLADIARLNGYEEIVFLDDGGNIESCMDYSVVGKTALAKTLMCDTIVAIGNAKIRERIIKRLQEQDVRVVSLIHPAAVIAECVQIGIGSVVMAGAVINPCAIIGNGCIINTGSSIDHDCKLEDYVHVSVGAHLAGNVYVGKGTWIGAGATVSNNISICEDCMVGAGAVVIRNIGNSGTYIGVPAEIKV